MVELVRSPRQADSSEAELFYCEQLLTEHAGINSSYIFTINGIQMPRRGSRQAIHEDFSPFFLCCLAS